MAWVTWRQHRLALAGVVAVFGAAAAYLLITGLPMHHAYAAVSACRPASSSACGQLAQNFVANHVHDVLLTAGLMQAIPVLVGAFVGAPAARARVRDRHLPLRVDAGLRADTLDDRQAGPARDRGHGRGRRVRRALLLVLPADHRRRRRRQRPAESHHLRPPRPCAPRLDAGRVRDRRPGRHPDPSGHPRDVRHRSSCGSRSPSSPARTCARTMRRRCAATAPTSPPARR